MIIVEGPDGSGKTTLVNWLKEELQLEVSPRVVSKETRALIDLQTWVDNNLELGLVPRIFDRHRLISEPIYGPILRDDAEPGFDSLSWLGPRMARFYNLKPLIIYCLPSMAEVMKNLRNDPDNIAVIDRAERIYRSYVSRVALDYNFAPQRPLVWNYLQSPTINGKPAFLGYIKNYLAKMDEKKEETKLW